MPDIRHACVAAALLLAPASAAAQDDHDREVDVGALVEEVKSLRGEVRRLRDRVHELEDGQAQRDAGASELAAEVDRMRAEMTGTDAIPRADVLRITPGFRLSGFAEMIYSYNPRAGSRTLGLNRFRAGDVDADSFALQAVQLVLEREAKEVDSWGLRVQAEYGVLADLIDADDNFAGGSDTSFSVSEWFVTYRAAALFGEGTDDWQAGRFQSPLGNESNENNRNVMVTRNPIYQLGTPTTHTGLRTTFQITPDLTATAYFVNGWDNQIDDESGKTGMLSLATSPCEDWADSAFTLNGSYGHEDSDDGHLGDKTVFGELLWTTRPAEDWSTILDMIWARTTDGVTFGGDTSDRRWHGGAAYVVHQVAPDTQLSGRLGYYSDDQFRKGRRRLLDASLAVRYEITEGLTLMLEYRHDWSPDDRPYETSSGRRKGVQDTATASVLVEF